MKRKLLTLALAFAMTVSLFAVGVSATEPTYGDTKGHWAESSIDRWSGYGVVQGSDGDFLPDGELTCAQLATILAKLLDLPAAQSAGFTDNPVGAWYSDAINRCAAAGILNGNGDGTVSPTATISRERAMVMLGRALGVEPVESPDLSKYGDAAKVAPYAQGMVAALIDAGIVGGVTSDTLAPQGEINRASTVTILDRAIGVYANTDGETVNVSESKGITLVVANNVTVTGNTDRLLVPASEVDVLLESSGNADAVTITGSDSTVTVKNTGIGGGEVIGDRSRIILDSAAATSVTLSGVKSSVETVGKSTIESVAVTESAANATVTVGSGATVQTVTNLAADVLVTGDGDVKNVETTTDMTVETPDTPVVNIGVGEDNVLADKDSTKSDSDTVNVDKGGSGSSSVHYHQLSYYTSNWDVHDSNGNYSTYWLTHTGRRIECAATVSGNCNHDGENGACSLCGYKNSKTTPFLIASSDDFHAITEYYENGDDEGIAETFFKVANEKEEVAIKNNVTSEQSQESYQVPQVIITGNATLDLNGKTISVDASNASIYGEATPVLFTVEGKSAKLTINDSSGDDSGTITCEEPDRNAVYGISIEGGAEVIINGGSYYGAVTAIQVTQGELDIYDGFFDLAKTIKAYNKTQTAYDFAKYIINCIDRYYTQGKTFTMKGGTVVGFDPSDNPEKEGTSYVADGYKVVSETQDNGDTWYTVVPEK